MPCRLALCWKVLDMELGVHQSEFQLLKSLFVRATDIKDGQILLDALPHVAANQPQSMEKCRLAGGEIIIVRSGVNTGDCAVVPPELNGAYAAYDLIAAPNTRTIPEYLCACLYTSFGRAQIDVVKNRAAQPHINADEVRALEVPNISSDIQISLVAELDAARVKRDRALAEADRLLSSMDDLVKRLLHLPELQPPTHTGYAIRLELAKRTSTISADYFHPERMLALRAIQALPNAALGALVSFDRQLGANPGDKRYIGLASVAGHSGQLTDAVETATGQCFTFGKNDVLYGRLRPYLNKVWLADHSGVCSTEFHVMRVIDSGTLLPTYLASVMRTQLIVAQTKHMMTGNTHPRLANEDVANLLIPLADKPTQQRIVDETSAWQAEAARLRAHAESVWKHARERFEQQLLKGDST